MVVEAVHALVRLVAWWFWVHVQAGLLKNLANLCGVEVLQLVEVNRLQQLLLFIR